MEKIKNPEIQKKLKQLSRQVAPCLQCASCAASCPVFQSHFERNPRKIAQNLAAGEYEDVFDGEAFWWCGACYSCEAHCPQGVPLTRIFFELKRLAVQMRRPIPQLILKIGRKLSEGFVNPVNTGIKEKRNNLGLPAIPQPDLGEIQKIVDISGLSQKLHSSNHE